MALPVKDSAGLNYQAGCVNLSGYNSLRLNLYSSLGKDDSVEAPGDHYVIAFDLSLDPGAVSQQECLAGDNRPLDLRLQPKCAAELKGAFQANGFVNKAGPYIRIRGLLTLSPRQRTPLQE